MRVTTVRLPNAKKLRGKVIENLAPKDDDILQFNSSLDEWRMSSIPGHNVFPLAKPFFGNFPMNAYNAGTTKGGVDWVANLARFQPMPIARDCLVISVSIDITTVVASQRARIGLYDEVDGFPANLIFEDEVTSLGGSPGVKSVSVSWAVRAGHYFLVFLPQLTGGSAETYDIRTLHSPIGSTTALIAKFTYKKTMPGYVLENPIITLGVLQDDDPIVCGLSR